MGRIIQPTVSQHWRMMVCQPGKGQSHQAQVEKTI